ncbi:hypothetical protein TNCV_979581 [Trichonephila clavipes]|uniref:Transposase n=1 Tax=Trichonephila clavipes TaxID=2585209 RepID=A0A8X6S4X5_TRICX|nr:hypothetical protein TNCV_979581 [Trichonephila clavipes]
MYYRELKLLSGIDVSKKVGKVSKTTNSLDVRGLPVTLKTSKRFLRWYTICIVCVNLSERRDQNCDLSSHELLHENAPSHRSLLVTDFLVKTKTTALPQPPYSPDLVPCDVSQFPALAGRLQRRRFQFADEEKVHRRLN